MSPRTQIPHPPLKLFFNHLRFNKEYAAPGHTDEDLVTRNARASDTFADFGLILIELRAVDMPENIAIPRDESQLGTPRTLAAPVPSFQCICHTSSAQRGFE